MSEELKIEVDVKANDDSAKKTLDNLIKEYNDKSLEFQVKLDKFDISGINNSITKLTSDLNKLSNIEFDSLNKLETNLKNINKLLNNQNKLSGNNIISENTGLENKIKEYLDLDKKINDAFTKLSKAELNRNDEVVASLNKEIDLLKQKQALVTLDLRGNNGFSDEIRKQVKLQEELNKAISQTQQAEYKTSFIDKLHTEAKKTNEEFDEIREHQEKINNFEMPEVFDTKGIKSYVDYLDSATDGIKRIVTQNLGTPGKDITTTLYGDGTEVRKVTNNIEKKIGRAHV